jgi:diguanylate cyclase (GGDEF)-like protein
VAKNFRDRLIDASEPEARAPGWMRLVGMAQSAPSAKSWSPFTRRDGDAGAVALGLVSAFEQSGRGWFWQTNADGALTYISSPLADRLGCKVDQLIGMPFAQLLAADTQNDFDSAQLDRTVEFTLSAHLPFENVVVSAAGADDCSWSLSGTPILDGNGRFSGFIGNGTDLSDQKKSEADATRMALYDALTGLPNRRLMRSTLEEMLKSKGNRAADCSLFLLDLDRFKNVNDTLGHPVGDALLKQVAMRLDHVLAGAGQVGRLGGDEFMVLISDETDRAALTQFAEGIITRLSLPYLIDDTSVQIGATIGVAIAPFDGDCPDELTRNADLALYAAKAAGKGTHRFYQPQMHAIANERRALENDLRDVTCLEQMELVYQPIVDAQSETVIGFEALVRWNHPVRGLVPPSVFIPIAEEVGLISRIGEWVVRAACKQAASWPEHLRISVNLSPVQFGAPGLVATIMNCLADSGLAASRLEIEITEGIFLEENGAVDQIFATLKSIGVRLVLDDFGTGYASLGYLNRVPLDKIKIDRSFVQGAVETDKRNRAIIQAIVGLAQNLNMETVAEGAETLDEVALIRELGCTQIQGFIFGKPMSGQEAGEHAQRSRPTLEEAQRALIERAPRIALLRFVKIHCDDAVLTAKMRNISSIGAMIEASGDAKISSKMLVEFSPEMIIPAVIRWRKGVRVGIEFESEIDVELAVHTGAPPRARRL